MKTTKAEREEAVRQLRAAIKPGDTIYTIVRHVSRTGMQRTISVYTFENNEPRHWSYTIARALEYPYDRDKEGMKVGGCGMDMGFHIVHTLGYALFREEASKGETEAAKKLREQIAKAATFYLTQRGAKMPDTSKPDQLWSGAAGYALKHRWL